METTEMDRLRAARVRAEKLSIGRELLLPIIDAAIDLTAERDDLRAQLTAERQRAEAAEARAVRAVAAEREACAGIADAEKVDSEGCDGAAAAAESVAVKIRVRGKGGQ